jgi:hypothetical protein
MRSHDPVFSLFVICCVGCIATAINQQRNVLSCALRPAVTCEDVTVDLKAHHSNESTSCNDSDLSNNDGIHPSTLLHMFVAGAEPDTTGEGYHQPIPLLVSFTATLLMQDSGTRATLFSQCRCCNRCYIYRQQRGYLDTEVRPHHCRRSSNSRLSGCGCAASGRTQRDMRLGADRPCSQDRRTSRPLYH